MWRDAQARQFASTMSDLGGGRPLGRAQKATAALVAMAQFRTDSDVGRWRPPVKARAPPGCPQADQAGDRHGWKPVLNRADTMPRAGGSRHRQVHDVFGRRFEAREALGGRQRWHPAP